ncbi:DinB family protein [Ponticoccus sp. (in: a-proteobacteria)]|uniref:DinB family protein n=1 Tax=Ponticoccus sp. (in: a-proteobacteria) TaxID=1925025 RepID=UPI003AB76080
MIVTPEYCVTMARYNAWQNRQVIAAFAGLDEEALRAERGAFFGSLLATANHLLWGDRMWLSRLTGTKGPTVPGSESTSFCATPADWEMARYRTDAEILLWAERLRAVDLAGELTWYSGLTRATLAKPVTLCIVHMFNHQTHHRGQIHAMLTAAGAKGAVTDLAFMPDGGPWL